MDEEIREILERFYSNPPQQLVDELELYVEAEIETVKEKTQ